MKKLYLLLIVIAIMAFAAGCKSAPPPATNLPSNFPAWFSELPPEDAVYGIGIAKLQNQQLAMELATTRAQRDAARQISVLVQGELIDFANESGLAENPRSMMSIENIGRNIINLDLVGATVNERALIEGTWYVRVAVNKANINRQVESIVNNEMADFAEFRADQALRRLEHQINNSSVRPQGLAE
ncbi:MAG: hypothetical protein LBC80_00430 [Treponema sp.]|jgi:hypothetical protein|nr:hypothetical protein [Treponema sp.]